jgi:Arc/MetJ family transcription regulator
MRTNIVINEKLVKEAFRYAKVKTKRDLIDLVLREYVANHSRKDLQELKGKVKIEPSYDYKALREEK